MAESKVAGRFLKRCINLSRMAECLASHRLKLMVEVTNQEDAVMHLMAASGYKAFDNRCP